MSIVFLDLSLTLSPAGRLLFDLIDSHSIRMLGPILLVGLAWTTVLYTRNFHRVGSILFASPFIFEQNCRYLLPKLLMFSDKRSYTYEIKTYESLKGSVSHCLIALGCNVIVTWSEGTLIL